MRTWCIPIVYRSQNNYIVTAESAEEAVRLAVGKFEEGAEPDACGNEWEEIDLIGTPEVVEVTGAAAADSTVNP